MQFIFETHDGVTHVKSRPILWCVQVAWILKSSQLPGGFHLSCKWSDTFFF